VLIEPTRTTARVPVTGSAKTLDPHATFLTPVPADERLAVTVRLKPQTPIPDGYAGESRDTFEREHGARPDDIARITSFAKQYGLEVSSVDSAARSIALSGSAAQMESAFGVELGRYHDAAQTYRGRSGEITVPAEVGDSIEGVFGLDDRTASKSHMVAQPAASATHVFTPPELAKAYDFPAGDGSGEHVGVISLGGRYDDRAQAAYLKQLGVPHVPFHVVNVDGGATEPSDPGPTGENMLDTETIGSLVPNADKTIYIAPNTDRGFIDAVATALHDAHHNTALSISWGAPEEAYTPQAIAAFNSLFKEAKAMGVNVFAAAGDNGATDGIPDGSLHTDFPSSSPSVIAAGGTKLTTNADGSIKRESVWNELRSHQGATGGGISEANPRPPDQHGLPIDGRGTPDISADADPKTGIAVLVPLGDRGRAALESVGGTSAVAPFYAALDARLEQNLGAPLGDFHKALYDAPAADFHDITVGNNGGYAAKPGWDAASGLGSVDGEKLLETLEQRH
jgi:kumamolisin